MATRRIPVSALGLLLVGAARPAAQTRVVVEYDQPIRLLDGVRVSADMFRPDGAGRFPVIVSRTPYDNARDPSGRYFAGGMATVYLAEDVKHKRRVAVKELKPELAAVLGAERFVQVRRQP